MRPILFSPFYRGGNRDPQSVSVLPFSTVNARWSWGFECRHPLATLALHHYAARPTPSPMKYRFLTSCRKNCTCPGDFESTFIKGRALERRSNRKEARQGYFSSLNML